MLLNHTKLHPPLSSDPACLRERLLPSCLSPLTVIHAPPGYGKTTLALQIIERTDAAGCWMSIDEFDNDPLRFWSGMVSSLGKALPRLGRQCLQLFSGAEQGLLDVVVSLLNELNGLLVSEPARVIVLTLDDVHHLCHPALIQSLNLFIDHLPRSLRIVVTSRSVPPLKLAQRKSKGLASEITSSALRFTDDETASFFETRHMALPTSALHAVASHCEGWAAALKLYSLVRREGTLPGLEGEHRKDIYEVLLGEVLEGLPAGLQDFLGRTAFLPRFCAPLASHVLGKGDASEDICALVRLNLFVVPLDADQVWLRYHDLFRSLVAARFGPTQDELAGLRLRAAEWFEAQGHAMEAMGQYLQSGHWPEASRLLASVGPAWMREGQTETVRRMLAEIPQAMRHEHPALLCLQVWIAPDAEKFTEGPALLAKAMSLLDQDEALRCEILTLQALVARLHGQWEQTITLSRAALASALAARLPLRWRSYLTLGAYAYSQGALATAEHHLQDALNWALEEQNLYGVAQSSGYLGEVLYQRGELQKALRMAHRVKHALEASPFGKGPLAAWRLIGLVDLLRECNELDEAENALAALSQLRGLEACESLQHLIILLRTFTMAMSRRDPDRAERAVNEIEAVQWRMRFQSVFASGTVEGLRAEVAWLRQDRLAATHWVERHLRQSAESRLFLNERDELVAVRLLVMLDQPDLALARAQELQARAAGTGRVVTQALSLMWQAAAQHAQGRAADARALMLDAFKLSAGEGFKRLFLDQGMVIEPVLMACGQHGVYGRFAGELAGQLRQEHAVPAPGHAPGSHASANQGAPAMLSPRELELLRYVRDGFSDKEIARLAHISPGTVKTHLRNIYRKLEANGRVQALAKLNLLAAA